MRKRPKLLKFLIRTFRYWRNVSKTNSYTPSYRILNIEQDDDNDYTVVVQLIGKNASFSAKPEKILADDNLVNAFAPTDIRTLTYLGYLGINSPKYKILAKRLSENSDQMLFALRKKGDKDYQVVTADEISKNEDIIKGLSQKEAHMVGLTTAAEHEAIEKRQKAELLKGLEQD